jgi:hypothetical protein
LIALGLPSSATALLRVQFESLTKAIWLFYVASDKAVAQLVTAPFTAADDGKRKASLSDMLDQLTERAPAVVVENLQNFRANNSKAVEFLCPRRLACVQAS